VDNAGCVRDHQPDPAIIEEVCSRGGHVIAVATEGDEQIKRIVEDLLYVPAVEECLSPMVTVVPL